MALFDKGMEYLIELGHTEESALSILENLITMQNYNEIKNSWKYDNEELYLFSVFYNWS